MTGRSFIVRPKRRRARVADSTNAAANWQDFRHVLPAALGLTQRLRAFEIIRVFGTRRRQPRLPPFLRRSHSAWCEAQRPAGSISDQVSAGHQPQDRQGHRPDDSALAAAAGGSGDRIVPLAHRRICGLCGRAFAIVMPPTEDEMERDKLCPACLTLPPAPEEGDDQPA